MFFMSFQELFSFSKKSKFRILGIQISWRHQTPKRKTRNALYWSKQSLLVKFGQFMSYYRRKKLSKDFTQTVTWKLVPDPLVLAKN